MKYSILPILLLGAQAAALAQPANPVEAARQFVDVLTEQQKRITVHRFDTDERYNWHYFPKNDRAGIALADLNDQQQNKAFMLLKSALSDQGYQKTRDIIELEKVLKVLENRSNDDYRNTGKYYFTIFGAPGAAETWGWRFEGHHISFNFSSKDGRVISSTPGFLGANPAIVPSGPAKGKQALKEETEAGFELVRSFNPQQLENAISKSPPPNDIITFVSRKASIDSKEGLSYQQMTKEQQTLFMKLLQVYVHRHTKLFAENMMNEIRAAGLEKLRFLWAGSRQADGNAYYYRIQGPTIIIEYDNSQGNANHIHTVVRDLKNDFGGDDLLEHYRKNH